MKDYFGYQGKTCVVTGASSGMGKAAAETLVDMGAKVYALDRTQTNVPGIQAYIYADLSNRDSIDAAFAQLPEKIDSFFGIAGVSGVVTDVNTTVVINYLANKYISEDLLPDRMADGGSIAFVTSIAGMGWERPQFKDMYTDIVAAEGWDGTMAVLEAKNWNETLEHRMGYAASKRMANHLVAQLQQKYLPRNIRVNAILPAATDTGMKDQFAINAGGLDNMIRTTGIANRLAQPREMAEPIIFINSDMASYISGALLVVDMGVQIQRQAGIGPKTY